MMLCTSRLAPGALRRRPQAKSAACPAGRRASHVARFKEGSAPDLEQQAKQVKDDVASNAKQAQDAAQQKGQELQGRLPRAEQPDTDPKNVNGPVKDVSELPLSSSTRPVGVIYPQEINGYKAPGLWLVPSFTRRREVFAGRLAILGFAAACAWEVINPSHPGPMAAASMLTGLSLPAVNLIFTGIFAHGLAGLVGPGGSTFSVENQKDLSVRPKGFPGTWINPITDPFTFLGIEPTWGFTKKNELFVGRLAMLGFFAAVSNEFKFGGSLGPLGQIALYLGRIPSEQYFTTAGRLLVAWSVLSVTLAALSGKMGEYKGDESVY